jgi:uncharacterized repeat protein (TIGR02543 family)
MYNKILRILSLALALVLFFGVLPSSESSAARSQEDRILQQITDTYKAALNGFGGSSLHGYCGVFVNWHLYLLGINTGFYSANGNQQYDLYKNMKQTTGGHTVEALPASRYTMKQALNYLSDNGTKDVFNVLLGFQYTTATDGWLYGHVMFIHAILDGKVYFSESYPEMFNGKYCAEGTPVVMTIDQFCRYYSLWTTYEGAIHFGRKEYQAQCEFFPAYLHASVTQPTKLYTAACTPDTDERSQVLRTLQPGERINVTGLYRNTEGQYWYRVEDAGIGYVPAADTHMDSMRFDDIVAANINAPTEQQQGSIFNIKGLISSTYTDISSVRAQVFTVGSNGLEHWMTTTDTVANSSYDLSYSNVSNKMAFRLLDLGTYRYELAAVVSNHYYADGMLQTQRTTLRLWSSDFKVVSQKGGTASVTFDTCGGTADRNAAEVELGGAIGALPEASRDGYHFLGWFTEPQGGQQITDDYVVNGSMTLYAHWEEAEGLTGWFLEDGKPYYVIDGLRIVGFFQVDGILYYQLADGFLATGWVILDDTRYYFNGNGSMVVGWQVIEGKTYYFGQNGIMCTGEQIIDGVTYYFGTDGALI